MTGELDLFSEEFQQCPFPELAALRRRAPVSRASNGWYVVTTIELARTVLTDPALFSNAVSRRTPPPPQVAAEVAAIRARGPPSVPTLLLSDPPRHTRYRRLVTRAFTPRALAWMEPLVEQVADELAAGLPADDTIDFITAFARPLPIWAISRVLGLPDARRDDVRRWTDAATATIGAQLDAACWPAVERDLLDLQLALADELAQRRDAPRDDLLSLLVQAASEVTTEDQPLGMTKLISMTRELMVAGNESSLRLLADIVWQLDRLPDECGASAMTPRAPMPSSKRQSGWPAPPRRSSAKSPATPRWAACPCQQAPSSSSRCCRPTVTSRCFPTRTVSSQTARQCSVTWPSARVCTHASATAWPVWRPAMPSAP